ncbi:spore coat associated protein CotJA [Tumebacillus lipolyticus]|uniref:Spore coat associated protein CotJA n=1 Tax=Tumebacillus lipolyticus TaxID=1280370 RepID=A0ABW5A1D4_9BACL
MFTPRKFWHPYVSPFDPCKPILVKSYSTPPSLYIQVQPPNLPQFDPHTALCKGTLWPLYYDPYHGPVEGKHPEVER